MNNRAPFQVIAIIPDGDDSFTEQVKQAVAQRFDLDLKHYSREFQEEGVCIQHALTLEDALKTTMVVQELGASCRVLDSSGLVITEGSATLESGQEDEEPALELDHGQDFSNPVAPSTLRDLAADDLVMLDGAIGDVSDEVIPELDEPRIIEGATARPEVGGADSEFLGTPLELDDSDPHEVGTEYEDPGAMEFPELTKDAEARERKAASGRPGRSSAADQAGGLFKELDDSLSGQPSKLAMATEEELKRQPLPRMHAPSINDAGSRSRRPSQAVAPRGGPARGSRVSRSMGAISASSGVVMFGGWFRDRPRLRIVVGFLLALGLGSVVPAVHASGAFKEQVKPMLVELSTARANEQRATKAPNVPSSRSVEEKINNRKTENFAYTLAIWLGCFAGIAVLWFRFC